MTEAVAPAPKVVVDPWWVRWGVIGLAAALIADVLYNVNVKKGDNGGTGPMIGVGIILVVLAAVLYTLVFPRFRNYPKAALVTGILSVVLLGAFWSGAALLVAPAAFGYGLKAPRETLARVGMVLAGLAVVVDIFGAIASAT